MDRYETLEISFQAAEPLGSKAAVDLTGRFAHAGRSVTVKGFYAGGGTYKVRYLPEEAGEYAYEIVGSCLASPMAGTIEVGPAQKGSHGPVRADGIHLRHADGEWFCSVGTTVYALAHQPKALIDETMATLSASPFNKVRMCVFPKHYNYNHNEPDLYPFERKSGEEDRDFSVRPGSPAMPASRVSEPKNDVWDVDRPCFAFWDALEARIRQLDGMGIQADLILFHPYDRWGFPSMPLEDDLKYLDYLLRRLSAFPNVWWSLANEYDLCAAKTLEDWYTIESFVSGNDPFRHMLSSHNCFRPWDWDRPCTTHVSWQTKMLYRVAETARRFGKPVLVDECCYEGNVPERWGSISGREMTARFWRTMSQGGYCTHGETFLPGTAMGDKATDTGVSEVVWWARGGKLNGESPKRIAFLREVLESLPGPLDPAPDGMGFMIGLSDEEAIAALERFPERARAFVGKLAAMPAAERDKFIAAEYGYAGRCGDGAFLWYRDLQSSACMVMDLPEDKAYSVYVIDTWNMTRELALTGASGRASVELPGREFMAVLAVREGIEAR